MQLYCPIPSPILVMSSCHVATALCICHSRLPYIYLKSRVMLNGIINPRLCNLEIPVAITNIWVAICRSMLNVETPHVHICIAICWKSNRAPSWLLASTKVEIDKSTTVDLTIPKSARCRMDEVAPGDKKYEFISAHVCTVVGMSVTIANQFKGSSTHMMKSEK